MTKTVAFDQKGFNREVGLRIAIARKVAGMSQEKLCRRIGVGRPQLANIEAGRCRVAVDQVWRVAVVLGLNVTKLIPERK
jgi:transcriptional regulator with XRE-family HTH domain